MRSVAVDGDLISEVVESGNRDQRIYLKKCFELQLAPSMLFIRSLPTQVIDIAQQRLGPQGAKACAQALSVSPDIKYSMYRAGVWLYIDVKEARVCIMYIQTVGLLSK